MSFGQIARTLRWRWILVLVIVSFGIGCGSITKSSRLFVLQPKKTGISTVRYYDIQRNRPVVTEVWYPVEESIPAQPVFGVWVRCPEARDAPIKQSQHQFPLIIISHGNGGDRMNVAWLAEILTANNCIVAAMDHHGNTWNHNTAEHTMKIWDRPKDVSFVISELLKDPRFCGSIDSSRIGFIGYSLGGHTGVWIAGGKIKQLEDSILETIPEDQIHPEMTKEKMKEIDFSPVLESYQDPRISAVFLMAPALVGLFDPASLASIQVPLYIVAPEQDGVVPAEKNGKMLARLVRKAALNVIPGAASHYVFLNEVSKGGKMLLDKRIAIDPPTVDRKQIHADIGLQAVRFFSEHLSF